MRTSEKIASMVTDVDLAISKLGYLKHNVELLEKLLKNKAECFEVEDALNSVVGWTSSVELATRKLIKKK